MAGATIRNGFRFGRFELDVRARELRKDRIRLRLQDQPFEVLLMLLQQPGEVLTREELRRRLWPDGTFVDFEHGLNAAVKRLRAALGDNAEHPRFVETLPRRGYRFVGSVERIDIHERAPAEKIRLAVLPFANLGVVNGHEYFSQGLTDEMITQLGRLGSNRLGVVARTSSMLVRHSAHTPREIGLALQVAYVLEGAVRQDGDRVRISAQLIETRGETQLWADSYERDLSDCFQVQAQVAAQIAQALAMELLADSRPPSGAGTRHAAANQAYLKGRYHWNKPGAEGVCEAISYYEQALRLDPGFSAAHAALGRAHVTGSEYYVFEPVVALGAARASALRALAIDPADSEAHLTLAEVKKSVDWDWDGAEAAYRLALAFNSSSEAAYRQYGLFLAARGRRVEAAAAAERACNLDPLCLVVNTNVAWVRYLAREYDETIEWCRHTLDMDADFGPARRVLAAALVQQGCQEDAVLELEQALSARHDPVSALWLAHAVAATGDPARASRLLNTVERTTGRYVSSYHLALAHTGIGDRDRAFALLNAACDARDPAIVNLVGEPRFEPLHADPRFEALMKRTGLRHEQQSAPAAGQ